MKPTCLQKRIHSWYQFDEKFIFSFENVPSNSVKYDHNRYWSEEECDFEREDDVVYHGLCLPNWANVEGWLGVSFPKESHLQIYRRLKRIDANTKGVMFPSFRMKDECFAVTYSKLYWINRIYFS